MDSMVITDPANFKYFTGLDFKFWESPTRPMYLVLGASEATKPVALVPDICEVPMKRAWERSKGKIITFNCPPESGIRCLIDAIASVPQAHSCTGFIMGAEFAIRMPFKDICDVKRQLAEAHKIDVADASPIIRELRLIKSQAEQDKIREACRIVSDAYDAFPSAIGAFASAHGGVTERDAVRIMQNELISRGIDDIPYIVANSGARGYKSIVDGPSDEPLRSGSVLTIDTGSTFDNYFADFNRNFAIGANPVCADVLTAHESLWQATEAGIAAAVPGNRISDVFAAMISSLESDGLDTSPLRKSGRIGHGLGIELTEYPSIIPSENLKLQPGMVLTLEPGLPLGDNVIVHEEVVLITDGKCELLSKRAPREMPIIIGNQRKYHGYKESKCTKKDCCKEVRCWGPIAAKKEPSVDAKKVLGEYALRSKMAADFHATFERTPIVNMADLAARLGFCALYVKDEGKRMGLKAFKGLGVSFAVDNLLKSAKDVDELTTMTDGNHGRAVARVARENGLKAKIFVPKCMSHHRKAAIENEGAEVVVVQGSYDDAIEMVKDLPNLVSDTAFKGYTEIPLDIMSGYSTMFREFEAQSEEAECPPITHVVLQAGVGGFAAAGAAWVHLNKTKSDVWASDVQIIIAEPTDADCILTNVRRGSRGEEELVMCEGKTESIMSGLNCGMPSTIAWPVLRDTCSSFVAIGDEWAKRAVREMHAAGIVAGESGAAGVGALLGLSFAKSPIMPRPGSAVLCINTEADTDPESFQVIIGGDDCGESRIGHDPKPVATLGFVQVPSDLTLDMEIFPILSQLDRVAWRVQKLSFANGSETICRDTFESSIDNISKAAATFIPTDDEYGSLDCIALACTSMSLVLGTERIHGLLKCGYPSANVVTDMASAISAALSAVVPSKRISLLTPYTLSVHEETVEFLHDHGFEVVASNYLNLDKDSLVSSVSPSSILRLAAELQSRSSGDGIFICCSAFRSTGIDFIDNAEATLGVPVVTSNQALVWHCLRQSGVDATSVKGFGKLFLQ